MKAEEVKSAGDREPETITEESQESQGPTLDDKLNRLEV